MCQKRVKTRVGLRLANHYKIKYIGCLCINIQFNVGFIKIQHSRYDFSSLEDLELGGPSMVGARASAAKLAGDLLGLKNHTYEC